MTNSAVLIDNISKSFRLYQERNQHLKSVMIRGRRSRYREYWALKNISLQIPVGSTFGIIGSNGSGKSTLLKCLAGILTPDQGSLYLRGRVSALLELGAGFHPELTGRENIFLNGAILGMTNREIQKSFDEIVDFAGLGQFLDTPVKNFSSGMIVRLGFAIATNVDPEILIIDEVLAVGDAAFQQRCFEKIESFRREGRTIIIVSHGLSQITQLCDAAAWLEKGSVRLIGSSYEVVNEYSGASHNTRPKLDSEQIGERWGTGEAEITSILLLDESGAEVSEFQTSKPALIRIFYSSSTPLKDVVFGVRITHLHGNVVWGTNTKRHGLHLQQIFGQGHIDLRIESLPLLEGTYDITAAISDMSEVNEYDHWERRTRFNVNQHGIFDEGLIAFRAVWSEVTP